MRPFSHSCLPNPSFWGEASKQRLAGFKSLGLPVLSSHPHRAVPRRALKSSGLGDVLSDNQRRRQFCRRERTTAEKTAGGVWLCMVKKKCRTKVALSIQMLHFALTRFWGDKGRLSLARPPSPVSAHDLWFSHHPSRIANAPPNSPAIHGCCLLAVSAKVALWLTTNASAKLWVQFSVSAAGRWK